MDGLDLRCHERELHLTSMIDLIPEFRHSIDAKYKELIKAGFKVAPRSAPATCEREETIAKRA